MQYGVGVSTYNRIGSKNKEKSIENKEDRNKISQMALYFSIAFFVSRVLLLNVNQTRAPFGISFVLVMSFYKNEKLLLPTALGSLI